jgi:hypothetical protein
MITKIFPRWNEPGLVGPSWNFRKWTRRDVGFVLFIAAKVIVGLFIAAKVIVGLVILLTIL